MIEDLPLEVELGFETQFDIVDHSFNSGLYFSNEEGDGSPDVTAVQGVEHPFGEPLLVGVVEGSELSSLAPSPCLLEFINIGESGERILGLGRKWVRWTTVGFPNADENF
jgi:hypothetical protein